MIDQLTAILTDKFGPFGPLMALAVLSLIPVFYKRFKASRGGSD